MTTATALWTRDAQNILTLKSFHWEMMSRAIAVCYVFYDDTGVAYINRRKVHQYGQSILLASNKLRFASTNMKRVGDAVPAATHHQSISPVLPSKRGTVPASWLPVTNRWIVHHLSLLSNGDSRQFH